MKASAKRGVLRGLLAASSILAMTAAASAKDLLIAMPNWPSGQASANIIKVGLAREFGLEAQVQEMGTLIAFAALDKGEADIYPETWRPNLDNLIAKYVDQNGTIVLAKHGVEAWQGLCATRVAADKVGIKDVKDLEDPAKTAELDTDGDGKGEVWIGAETWSSTAIERIRANSYGYADDLALVEGPEDAAMAAVDAAVATERPMVFYCYAPHHLFELHDIVRLTEPAYDAAKWKVVLPTEDPDWIAKSSAPVGWDTAHFYISYGSAMAKEHPDVAAFLEKVDFRPEEITEMSYAIQVDRQDPYEFAKKWVETNAARVDGWAGK